MDVIIKSPGHQFAQPQSRPASESPSRQMSPHRQVTKNLKRYNNSVLNMKNLITL